MNKNMEALNNMVHTVKTESFGWHYKEVIVIYDFRKRIKEPVHTKE